LNATGGFYSPPPGTTTCGNGTTPTSTVTASFDDPLVSIPQPSRPLNPGSTSLTSTCVAGMPTFQPGYYTSAVTLSNGCLAAGLYYFDVGATIEHVTSAAGGVLIFVKSGDLTIGDPGSGPSTGGVNLAPLPYAQSGGVVIFMNRDPILGAGTISLKKDPATMAGVIYAAAGTLSEQTPNSATLFVAGIDVK